MDGSADICLTSCLCLQVYLIHHDLGLYDEESQKRPECRALNIPEELGQEINIDHP